MAEEAQTETKSARVFKRQSPRKRGKKSPFMIVAIDEEEMRKVLKDKENTIPIMLAATVPKPGFKAIMICIDDEMVDQLIAKRKAALQVSSKAEA